MQHRYRARWALLPLLAALLMGAFVAVPAAEATGVSYGTVKFPQKDNPKVTVRWFTSDWVYLGEKNTQGGSYSLNLAAGTYYLQFVDQRPTYDTKKYAPTDIKVTVAEGAGEQKNVTMKKGAFITGKVKANGKTAKKADVIAANESEQSFKTTANGKGQFAIGGLPDGKYSLFSYDHKHAYVDKSTYAGKLTSGTSKNLAINLKKKAGSLRVYLFTSSGGSKAQVTGNPVVTAVSKKTGQFWSEKVKGGSAVFQGLYPGSYKLVANGFGIWFPKTGGISGGTVKAGTTAFGQFSYTQRGGWLTGTAVDSADPSHALSGAVVQLYDAAGTKLDETTSSASGAFTLDGLLTTQSGLTIVVNPGPYSPYLGTEPDVCAYQATPTEGFTVTTGKQTEVGSVGIDRVPGQQRPACM